MAAASALSLRDVYARWAATYPPEAHNALMRTEQRIVGPALEAAHPRRALDLGTGSGRYQRVLLAAGAEMVVGLDFAMPMLLRASAQDLRVCADALRLPFAAESFDVINASLVAGDVDDLTAWIGHLASVLERGGRLVYSDFHPSWTTYGWRRTFHTGAGEAVDLPLVPHAIEAHESAIQRAGLALVSCQEVPLLDEADPEVRAFRRRWGPVPVLTVVQAQKGSG
jgi:SAM-dependent methyltransferase